MVAAATLCAAPALGQVEGEDALETAEAFEQQPTSYLLSLYSAAGLVLQKRKVLPASWNPTQDYAELLVAKALRLKRGVSGLAEGAGGVKFRIAGIRAEEPGKTAAVAKLDASKFDRLAVVVFRDDFSIEQALIAPKDVVAPRLVGGRLLLSPEVLGHAGVEDVTAKVDRFTGDEF